MTVRGTAARFERNRQGPGISVGVGTVVVIVAALASGSVALAGFGLDSLIEIGASTVVIWQLNDTAAVRERRALRLIGIAFVALALYVAAQAAYTPGTDADRRRSSVGSCPA
jgi:hypothetical protein